MSAEPLHVRLDDFIVIISKLLLSRNIDLPLPNNDNRIAYVENIEQYYITSLFFSPTIIIALVRLQIKWSVSIVFKVRRILFGRLKKISLVAPVLMGQRAYTYKYTNGSMP